MSDLMTFPYSVEEFMERYKIVDTDGIYMSKGAELVPIFRMRQWFEHLPTARRTGRWMFTDAAPHRVYCSECYKTFIPNKEWYAWAEHIVPRKYCPNCGAKMDVQDKEAIE